MKLQKKVLLLGEITLFSAGVVARSLRMNDVYGTERLTARNSVIPTTLGFYAKTGVADGYMCDPDDTRTSNRVY